MPPIDSIKDVAVEITKRSGWNLSKGLSEKDTFACARYATGKLMAKATTLARVGLIGCGNHYAGDHGEAVEHRDRDADTAIDKNAPHISRNEARESRRD